MYRVLVLSMLQLVLSCTSSVDNATPYGIRPTKVGYIPARMAVFSCLYWPEKTTKLEDMPLGNYSSKEKEQLCDEMDQYVASGFDNQPFMKGLSAKFVEKLIASSSLKLAPTDAINTLWSHQTGDCTSCKTSAAFYISSIANRKDWQIWLTDLAKATKGADAVLLPMVLHYSHSNEDDRGLNVSKRSSAITMLLIDTATAELIWSGGREAEVVNKSYSQPSGTNSLQPPSQDELKKRLFTDSIWVGFPGRQIYK